MKASPDGRCLTLCAVGRSLLLDCSRPSVVSRMLLFPLVHTIVISSIDYFLLILEPP